MEKLVVFIISLLWHRLYHTFKVVTHTNIRSATETTPNTFPLRYQLSSFGV